MSQGRDRVDRDGNKVKMWMRFKAVPVRNISTELWFKVWWGQIRPLSEKSVQFSC
jgi:hypothetical protein